MTAKKYPRGWSEARLRRVLEHYESQTDEQAAAEIESGLESTTMEVPTALVPVVRDLIANRKSARARNTKTRKPRVAANKSRAA
jgi:16S rRNA C1402 N4-methylase RsmH